MTKVKYWSNYYNEKSPDQIPWHHSGDKLFNFLFKKFDLPKRGNVLDVGTGTGKKAVSLNDRGYKVWAFDVTDEAFNEAQENNPDINFFVSDAIKISEAEEMKDTSFDIVFDLLVTQFLTNEEKVEYLDQLEDHLNEDAYYVLQTFYKGKDIEPSKLPWVNRVAMSKNDIEEIYGKYFEIIDISTKKGKKGTDAVVVMKKK